jgi:hypothetical protein
MIEAVTAVMIVFCVHGCWCASPPGCGIEPGAPSAPIGCLKTSALVENWHIEGESFDSAIGQSSSSSRSARLVGSPMQFLITGTDTSGSITLRRETAAAALKRPRSLLKAALGMLRLLRQTGADTRQRSSTGFKQMTELA